MSWPWTRKKLHRDIFKNNNVSISHKIIFAKSYMLSLGCFQCGTWPKLNINIFKKFSSSVFCVYRRATKQYYTDGLVPILSEGEMLLKHNLIHPGNMLKLARLQIFCRMILKNVVCLMDVCRNIQNIESGWLNVVIQDLQFISLFQ